MHCYSVRGVITQHSNAWFVSIRYHHKAGTLVSTAENAATDNNIGKLGENIEFEITNFLPFLWSPQACMQAHFKILYCLGWSTYCAVAVAASTESWR